MAAITVQENAIQHNASDLYNSLKLNKCDIIDVDKQSTLAF